MTAGKRSNKNIFEQEQTICDGLAKLLNSTNNCISFHQLQNKRLHSDYSNGFLLKYSRSTVFMKRYYSNGDFGEASSEPLQYNSLNCKIFDWYYFC